MKLSGLYSIEVLIPSKQNLHYCSWVLISRGFYQYASHNWFWGKSLRKKQSAFTPRGRFSRRDLARTTNKRTKFLHCAKTHSQGTPCTNAPKVQAPSDQKKQAIQCKLHASPQRGPTIILMKERLWFPIQSSQKYEHSLKPLSKTAQNILRHGLQLREVDGAVFRTELRQRLADPHFNTRSKKFNRISQN